MEGNVMRIVWTAVVVVSFMAACVEQQPTPTSTTEETSFVCPLFVPICEAPCKLVGRCNDQCQCPGNVIRCGTSTCNAHTQVCCVGAINTYTCVNGDVCTF
jgi:hypothetical protein